jgi:subtilisin family serine protease
MAFFVDSVGLVSWYFNSFIFVFAGNCDRKALTIESCGRILVARKPEMATIQAADQGFAVPAKAGLPSAVDVLRAVNLPKLMEFARGRSEIAIGLIDGPVATGVPTLASGNIHDVPQSRPGTCTRTDSVACSHGTFVAGVLLGRRDSFAPAICPGCSLHLRTIFAENGPESGRLPSAGAEELAAAIVDCAGAGASIINLSLALVDSSARGQRELTEALDEAARRGVLVVAASGNQGEIGSTAITSHPWVIPVVASDLTGYPLRESNLGRSIGTRGLAAPGQDILSIGPDGGPLRMSGSSAAAPFVTGALGLLRSEFATLPAAVVKTALIHGCGARRNSVVPPLLNAWAAYQALAAMSSKRS